MDVMASLRASDDEVVFRVSDGLGLVLLNRPDALNALSLSKVQAIDAKLTEWVGDDAVRAVLLMGAGDRAFCAGGDIRVLRDAAAAGDTATVDAFFRAEYRLDHFIKTYPKPVIAYMNGITMGGGVGISVHGTHRIASERTVFAMPEAGIGLFPDVGATYFLPRCPGRIGLYLALTGARLRAADCLYAGIATHYAPQERFEHLLTALQAVESEVSDTDEAHTAVTCALDVYHEEPGTPALAAHRDDIDRCFSGHSLDDIFRNLEAEKSEWAETTLSVLAAKSPLSLRVTFRQMQLGNAIDFDTAMRTEYRLARRFTRMPDFLEGVRAVIVDKDNAPKWMHDTIGAVDAAMADGMFKALEDQPDLDLSR